MAHRTPGQPEDPLFPTRQGQPLTRTDARQLLDKHIAAAAVACASLNNKRVTPHTLRHTNAMLLKAGEVDIATIALWLGHESIKTTYIYQQADPALKQKAVEPARPPRHKAGSLPTIRRAPRVPREPLIMRCDSSA